MNNCIFCSIINNQSSADIISENIDVLSFKDINPQASTHILVIPKKHIDDVLNADSTIIEKMFMMANDIVTKSSLSKDGFRYVINTGSDGGQTVDHLHLHILGGRQLNWPPG
tara:strand:- start:541 stop:876 length:336 start_codon:yes stop_codon:yes gene_type:complete